MIEGNGGPGIVAASARGLLISGCYFEANNRRNPTLTAWGATPYAAGLGNYTVASDIILNGAYPPFGDSFQYLWREYASQAVHIIANSFAPSSLNASGVLLASVEGAVLSSNVGRSLSYDLWTFQ